MKIRTQYRIVTSEYACINKDAVQVERRAWWTLWIWEEVGLSSENIQAAKKKINNLRNPPPPYKGTVIEYYPKEELE